MISQDFEVGTSDAELSQELRQYGLRSDHYRGNGVWYNDIYWVVAVREKHRVQVQFRSRRRPTLEHYLVPQIEGFWYLNDCDESRKLVSDLHVAAHYLDWYCGCKGTSALVEQIRRVAEGIESLLSTPQQHHQEQRDKRAAIKAVYKEAKAKGVLKYREPGRTRYIDDPELAKKLERLQHPPPVRGYERT